VIHKIAVNCSIPRFDFAGHFGGFDPFDKLSHRISAPELVEGAKTAETYSKYSSTPLNAVQNPCGEISS
jgi:hypothetical protein